MSSSPSPRLSPLFLSKRYRLVRKLGSGSYGSVYLAEDGLAGKPVALKVLSAERLGGDAVAAFQREFRAIADLRHPHIASAYDFGYTEDKRPFYTREFVDGMPLPAGPPGRGPIKGLGGYLRPIVDVLEALDYLHAQGALHLDLHAGNVIVANDAARGAVLIDFGVVGPWSASRTPWLPANSSLLAPELVRGEAPGVAADVYGAGRLLLYRLSGRLDGSPRLPAEVPGWAAAQALGLERVLAKALDADPERRFPSARRFIEALAQASGVGGWSAVASEPIEITAGRDAEIERIEAGLAGLESGRGAVLWIEGPRGIGKTRLLTEARWRAQLRGLAVVEARFFAGVGSPRLGRLLRTLAPASAGGGSWLDPLSPEHGGSTPERAVKAARAYFSAPAPPLVLILDDIEAADIESRSLAAAFMAELSEYASGRTGRGLFLVLASSQPLPKGWKAPERDARRVLAPLPAEQAGALLRALIRPLELPPAEERRLLRSAGGSPQRLRRIALALQAESAAPGRAAAEAAAIATRSGLASDSQRLATLQPLEMEVLEALAEAGRGLDREEIAAAIGRRPADLSRALSALIDGEWALSTPAGKRRRFRIAGAEDEAVMRGRIPAARCRRLHAALAECLTRRQERDPERREALCRHLLACGRIGDARRLAFDAATELAAAGMPDRAASLLAAVLERERSSRGRVRIAEAVSDFLSAAGDHLEGLAFLEPVFDRDAARLDARAAVRLRRRLGVHCHRVGRADAAVRRFEEALHLADPRRDGGELVLIHSELAELHTFRGDYALAESSCERGLDALAALGEGLDPEFRAEMEVTLRATLGHLELRRLSLDRSAAEFEAARRLSKRHRKRSLHALVLNNLGIVYNQLSRIREAERCFRDADELLEAAGEGGARIPLACNLAMIAAKRGDGATAREEFRRACRLLAEHPGERLEFFVSLSGGVIQHQLGDFHAAMAALREALPLGRRLGDAYMTGFGEAYLAEACLACGQLGEARRRLEGLLSPSRGAPPLVRRMAASRLLFLGLWLGEGRWSNAARRHLEASPRSGVELLELWNDLFLAFAGVLAGDAGGAAALARSAAAFERLGIPSGAGLARAALALEAFRSGKASLARDLVLDGEAAAAGHRFLRAAGGVIAAEAFFALGDLHRSARCLEKSADALVGQSLLYLDWKAEALGARIAERRGDRDAARHRLHRALQSRNFLLSSLPPGLRGRIGARPEFSAAEGVLGRLELSIAAATPALAERAYHGMVGASDPMRRLFATLESIRTLDLPVLIIGATGTGKELVARAVHEGSSRRQGPFHSLACASLPEPLFEAELFGHAAGAFTGAEEARAGLLEHLREGTLFLDDLAQWSPALQGKLLQAIDAGAVRPLGAVEARAIDVRFIASMTSEPEEAIREGRLRRDLYQRLAAVELRLPRLNERREDVPALAQHFLERHARRFERPAPALAAGAVEALRAYDWPGNVRELETLLLRLLVGHSPGGRTVDAESVRALLPKPGGARLFPETVLKERPLEELRAALDREYLVLAFREARGEIAAITRRLGMKRSNLYAWLRKVGLDVRALRREARER
jgi:DNA-binding NtrC family response regulator/tetratricopeptide (TPR) repeat protein